MPQRFEPKSDVLPQAQREIWPQLAAVPKLSFVLYGGTAVALQLGHRQSLDFDFFCAEPIDKARLANIAFVRNAQVIQEEPQTLVVSARTASQPVRISFFGAITIGHVNPPSQTADEVLLVASLEDLMATKLKAILDRAEAKDYVDIAAIIEAGISLERCLGAFGAMFMTDPALPLRALGFFKDGDLPTLPQKTQDRLRAARDKVLDIPTLSLHPGLVG